MMNKKIETLSMNFGKKERVLNFTSITYKLTAPAKVGAVMELIRKCQPNDFEEWKAFYYEHAYTKTKTPTKVTAESLTELGIRLYEKITTVVIPEWTEAFQSITQEDCINYIFNLTLQRTYDGFQRELSVINDNLAKQFPNVRFEESTSEWDHAGDVDYFGYVGNKAFGIQIKPITANANFDIYKPSERMQQSHKEFEEEFGGKVFIVYSVKKEIHNKEVIKQIESEIIRLTKSTN